MDSIVFGCMAVPDDYRFPEENTEASWLDSDTAELMRCHLPRHKDSFFCAHHKDWHSVLPVPIVNRVDMIVQFTDCTSRPEIDLKQAEHRTLIERSMVSPLVLLTVCGPTFFSLVHLREKILLRRLDAYPDDLAIEEVTSGYEWITVAEIAINNLPERMRDACRSRFRALLFDIATLGIRFDKQLYDASAWLLPLFENDAMTDPNTVYDYFAKLMRHRNELFRLQPVTSDDGRWTANLLQTAHVMTHPPDLNTDAVLVAALSNIPALMEHLDVVVKGASRITGPHADEFKAFVDEFARSQGRPGIDAAKSTETIGRVKSRVGDMDVAHELARELFPGGDRKEYEE